MAEAAGIAVDNGIVVDGQFRTSDPNVFAAGDCCNFQWKGARVRLESWKAAQDQGAHVAVAMLVGADAYAKVPWFWSDQYDLTLQVAGMFDMTRAGIRRETRDDTAIVFQCDAAGHLIAAAGIGPGNAVAKDLRILEKADRTRCAGWSRRIGRPVPEPQAPPESRLIRHRRDRCTTTARTSKTSAL
nr:oxidoreductase C-terminal domain-containing protein [Sagittula salina]